MARAPLDRPGDAACQWADLDLAAARATIRRSVSAGAISTPKSGKGRRVALPPGLVEQLRGLRVRQGERVLAGQLKASEWVFPSRNGTAMDPGRVSRRWDRIRQAAARHGVRPLKLHAARHTFATMALGAAKSLRWTAAQLGHADPALTLRTYAKWLPEEEADLSFADFGVAKRQQASTRGRGPRGEGA